MCLICTYNLFHLHSRFFFRLTHFPELMGRRGRDIMVVGFAITYATSDYHH